MKRAGTIGAVLVFSAVAALAQPELVVQTGHFSTVCAIAYSRDGKLLASGDTAGWIVLWNAETGDQLRAWKAHESRITSLVFGPGDTVLISSSLDGTVQVWDHREGKRIGTPLLAHQSDGIDALALNPEGSILATASDISLNGPSLKLWRFSNGVLDNPTALGNDTSGVSSIAFSPDGKQLVSSGHDHTVKRWDLASGSVIHRPFDYVQNSEVSSLAFSPDGRIIASGGGAGLSPVIVWDLDQEQALPLVNNDEWISSLAFNPKDGQWLVAGTGNPGKALHLWNLKTGEQRMLPTEEPLLTHPKDTAIYAVAFSPDGTRLASGGSDYAVTIHNPNAWDEQPRSFQHHVRRITSLGLSADGQLLVSATRIGNFNRGDIRLWSLSGQREPRRIPGDYPAVVALALSPGGDLLATAHSATDRAIKDDAGAQDGEIRLWNTADGEEVGPVIRLPRLGMSIVPPVGCLAFSRDGKLLASGGENGTIRVWVVDHGSADPYGELKELPFQEGEVRRDAVRSMAFSPKGGLLAVATRSDMQIHLWNVTTKTIERTVGSQDDSGHSVRSLAFNRDGNLLASGTTDGRVQLWNPLTGQLLRTWQASTNTDDPSVDHAINSVVFFPDGKKLASASEDHNIHIWNVESKSEEPQLRLQGTSAADAATALAVSQNTNANQDMLWSSGVDSQIRLWNISNPRNPSVARLIPLDDSDWAVIDSVGRFDSDNLDEMPGLRWVLADQPFDALPPEIFMHDYYEPRLLQRLLERETLKPVSSLANLNRVQPVVEIENVEWANPAQGVARVTVSVKNNTGTFLQNGRRVQRSSGVYDLHLLRDRQLVGWALKKKEGVDCQGQQPDSGEDTEEKKAWRRETCVDLERNGSKRLIFTVQVPRRVDLGKITFTAYAFNVDQVKSATASRTLDVAPDIKPRRGKAYIITVGVNRTESSPEWDLQFAANDARRLSSIVGEKLESTARFSDVVRIRLISDQAGNEQIGEAAPTKANIKAVLDLLAGRPSRADVRNEIPGAEMIEKAQPEDIVLLAFSSHGFTDENGGFHIVLADIGRNTPQGKVTAELQMRSLSSRELSEWLREVDAGELIMVVDSCHSAATVEADGFKPGPMGSRGLGQLAYDKGMRILAASKSEQSAVERGVDSSGRTINDGLLTYALVHEGLEEGLADFRPKDGKILISEWLAYAVQEVPKLFNEGDDKGVLRPKGAGQSAREVVYHGGKKTLLRYQQPVLFDLARSGSDVNLTTTGP